MTNGGANDHLNKNQRREAARDKARLLREQQKKKDKRGRVVLQGSLILVTLAIVATITLIIVNSIKPPAPGPLNMASGGITIGQDLKVIDPGAPGATPVPSPSASSATIPIQVWVDYQCPYCGQFESANTAQISTLLNQGAATVEIHPVAILDSQSLGSQYSTRAANAAACVANYSPNSFYQFNSLLFANQPREQSAGLTDKQMVALTNDAKVAKAPQIAQCITDQQFKSWVQDSTASATGNTKLLTPAGQFATPTVLVAGNRYGGAPSDATAFSQFVAAADAAAFAPSPSPSPTP